MISNDLIKSCCEKENVDASKVLDFLKELSHKMEIHNVVMIRNGKVILEANWYPYSVQEPHVVNSVTKTFIGIGIGMLYDKGLIRLEDKLISFFPDYQIDINNKEIQEVTIKHVLTMSMGQDVTPSIGHDRDWVSALLNNPLSFTPGSKFHYDSLATFMLSAVFKKVTGVKISTYLEENLFKPLHIKNAYFLENHDDITMGGLGLFIPTIGLAKTGWMLINKGMFNDKRILSEEWVNMALSKQIDNANVFIEEKYESRQGYGFQCWMCTHDSIRMSGLWGQMCLMVPHKNIVLAINARGTSSQPMLDVFFKTAYEGILNTKIEENEVRQKELDDYLKGIEIPPLHSTHKPSLLHLIKDAEAKMSSNLFGLEKIKCQFKDDTLHLIIIKNGKEYVCSYGLNRYKEGKFNICKLYPPYYDSLSIKEPDGFKEPTCYASYCWQDNATVLLSARYDNEATDYQIRLHFDYEYIGFEWMPQTIFTKYEHITAYGKYRTING